MPLMARLVWFASGPAKSSVLIWFAGIRESVIKNWVHWSRRSVWVILEKMPNSALRHSRIAVGEIDRSFFERS